MKTDSNAVGGIYMTFVYDDGRVQWHQQTTSPQSYDDWTELTTSATLIPATVKKIQIAGYANNKDGNVWFDDFSLKLTDELPPSSPSPPPQQLGNLWITAYYWANPSSTQWVLPIEEVDFGAVTHIVHTGIEPKDGGGLELADLSACIYPEDKARHVIETVHNHNRKILLGVSGNFPKATETDNRVDKTVNDIVNTVLDYGYDGVDIDWEHHFNNNFSSFISKLRTTLTAADPNLLLTIAAGGDTKWVPPEIIAPVHDKFDQINLMSYDYPDFEYNFQEEVQFFLNAGIPAEKLAVGISYTHVDRTESKIKNKLEYAENQDLGGAMIWALNRFLFNVPYVEERENILYAYKQHAYPYTPPTPLPGLAWDAEKGSLSIKFKTNTADGITYIYQDSTTYDFSGGIATYLFEITQAGEYQVKATVQTENGTSNSFFVNIDDYPGPLNIWDIPVAPEGQPEWREEILTWTDTPDDTAVNNQKVVFNLDAKQHRLYIKGRENYAKIDNIEIISTSGSPPPTVSPTPSPSPSPSEEPSPPPITSLSWRAEEGIISGAMGKITNNSQAGETSYVVTNATDYDNPVGTARYEFTIDSSGDYLITAQVEALDQDSNSYFVYIDNLPPENKTMIWDIYPFTNPDPSGINFEEKTVTWRGNNNWDNPEYSPKYFNLTAGSHTLYLQGREVNTKVDSLTLVKVEQPISWPAESGQTPAGFNPFDPGSGSGRNYIYQPVYSYNLNETDSSGKPASRRAEYEFTLNEEEANNYSYFITAEVNTDARDGGSNSFFINISDEPTFENIWDIPISGCPGITNTGGWREEIVSWTSQPDNCGTNSNQAIFDLSPGIHKLIIMGREKDTYLDNIKLMRIDKNTTLELAGGNPICRANLNDNDGIINLADIVQILQGWGSCEGCIQDFDDNGVINLADLQHLLMIWGEICPQE